MRVRTLTNYAERELLHKKEIVSMQKGCVADFRQCLKLEYTGQKEGLIVKICGVYADIVKHISKQNEDINYYFRSACPRKGDEKEKLDTLIAENSMLDAISAQLDFEFRTMRYFGLGQTVLVGRV